MEGRCFGSAFFLGIVCECVLGLDTGRTVLEANLEVAAGWIASRLMQS